MLANQLSWRVKGNHDSESRATKGEWGSRLGESESRATKGERGSRLGESCDLGRFVTDEDYAQQH